jgi:hypothetical protein
MTEAVWESLRREFRVMTRQQKSEERRQKFREYMAKVIQQQLNDNTKDYTEEQRSIYVKGFADGSHFLRNTLSNWAVQSRRHDEFNL